MKSKCNVLDLSTFFYDSLDLQLLLNSTLSKEDLEIEAKLFHLKSIHSKQALIIDINYCRIWFSLYKRNISNITKNDVFYFVNQHLNGLNDIEFTFMRNSFYKVKRVLSLSTILRRMSSLSTFLSSLKLYNPVLTSSISRLLKALKREHGVVQKQASAITKDVLLKLIASCDDSIVGIRNKALLLFTWCSGGRRVSEVVGATFSNLSQMPDGSFLYTFVNSKVHRFNVRHSVPIIGVAAEALHNWIHTGVFLSDNIFCSINKSGEKQKSLHRAGFTHILKQIVGKSGLDPVLYSPHSLRSGFVTEAGIQGVSITDVMEMTGHKSIEMTMRYYRRGHVLNNRAANLLD